MSQSIQATATTKPLRCLVIQLTRLGDTLQSLMALRAAKQLYPNLEIHFLARERFASAAKRVPWIEKVITLPTDVLVGPVVSGAKSEQEGVGDIARWVAPLVKEPWDMVVNWSFSEASSYLAGLLPARIKLGYTRRRDTSFSSADGWSHYIQAIVQGGIGQNIHLTDILTTQLLTALQIHQGEPVADGNVPVTSKSFFTLEKTNQDLGWSWKDLSKKWIAIQLGAGNAAKVWEPENWGRLVAMIQEHHPEFHIVLLGGDDDKDRARRLTAEIKARGGSSKQVLSLVGETNFDLWTSVVGRCQWILSGDTAALHLASVLGTRVLNVSVGPVRWAETGPYGNGHYVVASNIPCSACETAEREREPSSGLVRPPTDTASESAAKHRCREDVRPEAVFAAWSFAASQWNHRKIHSIESHFAQLGWTELLNGVQIFKSRIRSTNDGGGVVYEPLIQRALEMKEWTSLVVGHVARAWYCGWVPAVGQGVTRERMSPGFIQKLRELNEGAEVMFKLFEEAGKTAQSLKNQSSALKSEKIMRIRDKEELASLASRLQELDLLVDRVTKTQPALKVFSQMSRVLMHNLNGTLLAELGHETAESYRQLNEGVAILKDWVKYSMSLARPRPVLIRAATALNPPGKGLSP